VTRDMWGPIWPGVPDDQRPVRAITNGVHVPTWLSSEMTRLFDDHLEPGWRDRHDDPSVWKKILEIPDEELWAARQALRNYLFFFIRERARSRWKEEHVTAARVVAAGTLLDPNALTIGFARRFTGYKRPELVFHNPDRLFGILNAARRPVQLVFAGKAHPADETGKHHLQQVYRRAVDPKFGGRIAFVDDYDLHVAHFLVQGCDVWLNNPRKPLEASGTSGMKASINGVPNLSIGDGWWAEGYTRQNGWLIEGPQSGDAEAVDAGDAAALYDLLEREIVPTFFDRDPQGVPRRWLSYVRQAILSVTPAFSARRMLKEYADSMYRPAMRSRETELK
jgi:starch phosphorylase